MLAHLIAEEVNVGAIRRVPLGHVDTSVASGVIQSNRGVRFFNT